MVAARRVEPSKIEIEGSLTEQFKLEPMSDVCPSTGCERRAPRHSVCAGSLGIRVPQWWKHGDGADTGDDEIGIACECRAAVWLVGEGDLYALTPREWKAAVLDFAADLGHDRADRRVRREARALAKCIAALRSGAQPNVVRDTIPSVAACEPMWGWRCESIRVVHATECRRFDPYVVHG